MNKVEFLKQYLIRDPISKNAALQALKDWDKLPLYAFLYNPMIHESGYITVSIHRTREGAEKALEWHKKECREEYAEIHGDFINFGHFESWQISEITIQD